MRVCVRVCVCVCDVKSNFIVISDELKNNCKKF